MKLNDYHLYILWNWRYITDDERKTVKRILLPEDDLDTIVFDVNNHPTLDFNGNIVMDWCDITVYEKNKWLCDIYVNYHGQVEYNFP